MNQSLPLTALVMTALFLALTTAITVASAAAVVRALREPGAHRLLWRSALATILLLVVGESTGLFAAGGAWLRYQLATWTLPPAQVASATSVVAISELSRTAANDEVVEATDVVLDLAEPVFVPDDIALADEYELDLEVVLANLPDETLDRDEESINLVADGASRDIKPGATIAPVSAPPAEVVPPTPIPWQRWFAWAWGAVAVALVVRLAAARLVWLWRFRHAKPVSDREIKQCVGALARELKLCRRVAIWTSPRWVAPVAWGVWRPSIGLPEDFRATYSPAERDAMLAHELGHLAARDPAWQCLADGVVALLWWAPWCWWLRRQLRIAAEWMADEASLLVADGPQALAECLVVLGRRMTPEASAAYAVTGSFRSNLGRRVERLLKLAESADVENAARRPDRWRMPALAVCVALGLVAGSAWARSGIESTQGADHMRWFEQSWRRSLAGGLVSMALGAPTTAVLAQEDGAEAVVEVEVALEDDADDEEDDDDDDDGEDAEEAAEAAEEEADEAAEEAAEAAEDDADDEGEGDDEEIAVEVELALEEVGEEIDAAMEEVDEELTGALDEVAVEIEAAISEVSEELDAAIHEADQAAVEVETEVQLTFEEVEEEEDDDDDGDDADEAEETAAKVKEAKAKAVRKAIVSQHKALKALKEKLGRGLKEREVKTRAMHEKMHKQRDQAVRQMEKSRANALEGIQKAREEGSPHADEMQSKLEEHVRRLELQLAEQEEMMKHRLREAEEALRQAQREAEERLTDAQRHSEGRVQLLLQEGDEGKPALRRRLADARDAALDRARQVKSARAGKSAEQKLQMDVLMQTINSLREQGHEDAASQLADALKLLASQQEDVVVEKSKKQPKNESGADGELHGRVDQLQGEVNALRGEIAELRDLLKQALSERKDGPPAP